MKLAGIFRKNGTLGVQLYNSNKHIVNGYFVQLSFKAMWLYPHREQRYNNGSWIFGWLFLYFGNIIADKNIKESEK